MKLFYSCFIFLNLCACQRLMVSQPRYNPYGASDFFANGTSAQEPPAHTVPRGELHVGNAVLSGQIRVDGKNQVVKNNPLHVDALLLARGRESYGIFCAACHSPSGDGDGIVVRRGFPTPPTFHQDRLRIVTDGYIFSVISHGFGKMYRLGDRIAPQDRWAIVAYVRALQLSQHAPVGILPEDLRAQLKVTEP